MNIPTAVVSSIAVPDSALTVVCSRRQAGDPVMRAGVGSWDVPADSNDEESH